MTSSNTREMLNETRLESFIKLKSIPLTEKDQYEFQNKLESKF